MGKVEWILIGNLVVGPQPRGKVYERLCVYA